MAAAKIGTKARPKEDRGKFLNSNGSENQPDFSVLRKPIKTSITGFAQARKIFDTATEELKGLLTSECDLLYECKVCRNLFRSLANFISHKRVYCKEKFNSLVHGHFIKSTSTASEISKIKQLEEGYQEYLRNRHTLQPVAPLERVPLSKDLTGVVENLMKSKEVTTVPEESVLEVAVQDIPSTTAAVFQNIVNNDDSGDDMSSQITELNKMTSKDIAVLKEDGKFETCAAVADKDDSEQVIQISDDDDVNQLSCKLCDKQFSTRKTQKFHMKYKHVPDRLVYPCPECCDIFSTSWSVFRHLYRAHRRTLTQIRRMRELVQSRAFKMNNMPYSFVKKKNNKKVLTEEKLTEEERMDQENQAWMDNMESDSELPRCGGCGRSFERRAALAAHTYTCQSRTRALARKPAQPDKRPEAQAKRDGKPTPRAQPAASEDGGAKLTIKQMKPSIMEKEIKEKETTEEDAPETKEDTEEPSNEASDGEECKDNGESDAESDSKCIVLNFPAEVESANMDALKKKMAEYVEGAGTCRLCRRGYTSTSHLCRHMGSHLGWRRYGCKLCSYVNYDKNRLVLHAQNVHKLKGSDEFYASIIRVLPAGEALGLSLTPELPAEGCGDGGGGESDSCDSSPSSDNGSESGSSRTEPVRPNRRKQTFKPVRLPKAKTPSPTKEEEKLEKAGTKRPAQIPLDKLMEVILGDNDVTDKSKPKIQAEKKESPIKTEPAGTGSRRPMRRMRPKKDEDFEYDFTNVMKWEASSYKDSDSKPATTSRTITSKRRSQAETSPSESSPEKTEKQDRGEKQEKTKEEKTQKQDKSEAKRKSCGALATMSDAAVSQSRAHLRPSTSFTSSRSFIEARRAHFRTTHASKVVSAAPDAAADNQDIDDIEKQIDEANAKNKITHIFRRKSLPTLVLGKKSIEVTKHNIKKQVIVMKRVNSSGESSQTGSMIQFPSIKCALEKSELKPPTIAIKIPRISSTTECEKNASPKAKVEIKTDVKVDNTEKLETPLEKEVVVSSNNNKGDEV